jgi:hypothetical protein
MRYDSVSGDILMAERVPEYALAPLKALLRYAQTTLQFLEVTVQGIKTLIAIPDLTETIASSLRQHLPAQWEDKVHQENLRKAKESAAFAEKESQAGFPFLHESALVGLWGAMEAMVEDLVVALLLNEPELLQREQFAKIKISLGDYESLDKEERVRYLVSELRRNLRTTQRQGINAFESLLECVNLSGAVPEPARKSLWELSHLRNVIVHRRSLADRSLVSACPSLGLKIGERVKITPEQITTYGTMISGYGLDLVYRLAQRYGVKMTPKEELLSSADAG